jgi:MFS family permease
MTAPGIEKNPRRFVIFTVLYNVRVYYPVLAILFLDLGLTLDQFMLLNLVWAATIFLFEVPSGALADTLGRRRLLIASAALMVLEMLCLLVAPRNGGWILVALCIVNRVLSGLSEACASGADEAIAFDSLAEVDRAESWDKLLATAMRCRSAAYVLAMIVGALMYDPKPLNQLLPAALQIPIEIAHRLPVVMVLGQALGCLFISWKMVEPPRHVPSSSGGTCGEALKLTLRTARWIFTNPRTLVIVVIGLAIDSIVRNFATINSSYYRLIELPEWSFGIIGASVGLLGWFVPGIARRLNQRFSTLANLAIAAGISTACLAALIPAWPWVGLLPAMFLMTTLGFLGFTVSRALHAEADSSKRATALSVKGLAFNLGYGLFSLAFSRLLLHFPKEPADEALRGALFWQVPAYALVVILLFTWGNLLLKRHSKI